MFLWFLVQFKLAIFSVLKCWRNSVSSEIQDCFSYFSCFHGKKLKVQFEKLFKQVMSLANQWNAGSKVLIPTEMPIFWLDQRINTVNKLLFSLYLVKWTDFIEKLVMQMANNPLNSRHYFKKTFEPFISIKSPHSQQKIFFGLLLKIFFWKIKGLIR